MEQTRRDFFGVIAAPVFRRLMPLVPIAPAPLFDFATDSVRFGGGPALTVESLRDSLREIAARGPQVFMRPRVLIVRADMEAVARRVLNGG